MGVVLGMEGGGDHSHAVVADTSGTVLGLGINDDASNWEDVGIQAAAEAIRSCVREALTSAGATPTDVGAAVFAVGGIDFPMDAERYSGVPAALGLGEPWTIVNDAFAALRAGCDRPYGVVVLSGNGSVVVGRNPDGDEARSLGLGPLFGDGGSASDISDGAVTAVAEAYTGRGDPTLLTDAVCARVGASSPIEFLDGAARGRVDVASFAPDVWNAARAGDGVAEGIIRDAGRALGRSAAHVIGRLGMTDVPFELVLAGAMFQEEGPWLVDALRAEIEPVTGSATPRPLHDPSVVGAVLMAIELCGNAALEDVHARVSAGVADRV
jgi:N-acetylglucosamine kinase-like BadF-type ATPase